MSGAATSGYGSGSVQRLLEGKLHPPRARPEAVVRRRLLERLDASASPALTLASAPVGFGKTMLVQSWCADHGGDVAWVSLDPADDDPSRLWAYVACSLERVGRGLGQTALHRLRSPGVPPELVVDALVDALRAHREPVTVVLDDLHAVSNPVALGSLTYALERLPAHARVVAATRQRSSSRARRAARCARARYG
jgi:ATP/maltotriose-dependent transcriptional regulator MalT